MCSPAAETTAYGRQMGLMMVVVSELRGMDSALDSPRRRQNTYWRLVSGPRSPCLHLLDGRKYYMLTSSLSHSECLYR